MGIQCETLLLNQPNHSHLNIIKENDILFFYDLFLEKRIGLKNLINPFKT